MHENGRRAVRCQRVVKARMFTDVVNLLNIVEARRIFLNGAFVR